MSKRVLFVFSAIAVFITVFIGEASAQENRSLTLEESIEIAKQNSPLARAARYELVSSKWRFKSFQADLRPSLNLSGDIPNYLLGNDRVTTQDGIIYRDFNQSDANVEMSINQAILPTGGNVFLTSGISRLGIFRGEESYAWQSTPLVVTLRQPLFQFNSLKWRNRTEPLRYEIAQKQFVEDMEDLAFTVTQSFFNFLLAQINVEVAEFNVTVNDSIYNISQGRYQVGNIAENDLLQSELQYRNAESDLSSAQLNLKRAEENFKALLGVPDGDVVEVIVPAEAPELNVDVDKALALARENNSTALQFELSEIMADQAFAQAKKEAGFSATVQASYGLNRTASDFSNLYDDPENRQFFTVGFQIPIFNWGKNLAEIRSARNQQQATANNIAYQKLQFDLDVRSTVREFSQLRDQVLLAETSDEIADRRYEVAKNRYLIGKIDVTNLFIAQNEKDSARRSYIQALRNYWTGYYNLRRLTLYNFERNRPIEYSTDF